MRLEYCLKCFLGSLELSNLSKSGTLNLGGRLVVEFEAMKKSNPWKIKMC
jgi:hypothetical protein